MKGVSVHPLFSCHGRVKGAMVLVMLSLLRLTAKGQPLDVAILNIGPGRLFDGSSFQDQATALGIRGGQIVSLGPLSPEAVSGAGRVIDAKGLTVSPGFIDVHSHALETLARPVLRGAESQLAQGVTTLVGNPDGGGPVDLVRQRVSLEGEGGIGVNAALLIGHGSVRSEVLGDADRAPTREEMGRMTALVRKAVKDGAWGLSSGLFYTPGRFANTEEVILLARAAGGVYTSHIRDEGDYDYGLIPSVDEVIRVAGEAGVTGIVTHVKALGPDSWGQSAAIIQRIETARQRGIRVWADQYPYAASSTSLSAALLPGITGEKLREQWGDVSRRASCVAQLKENLRRRGGPQAIVLASAGDSSLNGQRLDQVARKKGVSCEEAVVDILLHGGAKIVSFNMKEEDVRALMVQPWTMTSSDGGLVLPGEGFPHPRNNGAFARKLAWYVRDQRVMTLPAALRSMTSLPAEVFGFRNRGVIRVGAVADLVLLDPEKIQDHATYQNPHAPATGVECVLIGGRVVWQHGRATGARAGVVLRPSG